MTDALAAMRCLASAAGTAQRTAALTEFFDKWKDDQLFVDKWLLMQSTAKVYDIVAQVDALIDHKDRVPHTAPGLRLASTVVQTTATYTEMLN